MSIFDEVQQLEHLAVIGKSLIKYAISLEPGIVFERRSTWWVPNDERDFVSFQFHWSTNLSVTMQLYGSPQEQFMQDDLLFSKGRQHNCVCRVTGASQLMAATVAIWRAHQLFERGSLRQNSSLYLMDELETINTGPRKWLRPRPDQSQLSQQVNPHLGDTREWYDEVRDFMRRNRINESTLPT